MLTINRYILGAIILAGVILSLAAPILQNSREGTIVNVIPFSLAASVWATSFSFDQLKRFGAFPGLLNDTKTYVLDVCRVGGLDGYGKGRQRWGSGY